MMEFSITIFLTQGKTLNWTQTTHPKTSYLKVTLLFYALFIGFDIESRLAQTYIYKQFAT